MHQDRAHPLAVVGGGAFLLILPIVLLAVQVAQEQRRVTIYYGLVVAGFGVVAATFIRARRAPASR